MQLLNPEVYSGWLRGVEECSRGQRERCWVIVCVARYVGDQGDAQHVGARVRDWTGGRPQPYHACDDP